MYATINLNCKTLVFTTMAFIQFFIKYNGTSISLGSAIFFLITLKFSRFLINYFQFPKYCINSCRKKAKLLFSSFIFINFWTSVLNIKNIYMA